MATQSVAAAFNSTQDSVAVTWAAMTGNYAIVVGTQVTDGGGPVAVELTSVSSSGATVVPSARFTGSVALTVFDKP